MAYHPCEQKVKILLNTFFEKCEEMGWKGAVWGGAGGLYRSVSLKPCFSAKIKVENHYFQFLKDFIFEGRKHFWSSVAVKLHLGAGVWVKVQDLPQSKKREK